VYTVHVYHQTFVEILPLARGRHQVILRSSSSHHRIPHGMWSFASPLKLPVIGASLLISAFYHPLPAASMTYRFFAGTGLTKSGGNSHARGDHVRRTASAETDEMRGL